MMFDLKLEGGDKEHAGHQNTVQNTEVKNFSLKKNSKIIQG